MPPDDISKRRKRGRPKKSASSDGMGIQRLVRDPSTNELVPENPTKPSRMVRGPSGKLIPLVHAKRLRRLQRKKEN